MGISYLDVVNVLEYTTLTRSNNAYSKLTKVRSSQSNNLSIYMLLKLRITVLDCRNVFFAICIV